MRSCCRCWCAFPFPIPETTNRRNMNVSKRQLDETPVHVTLAKRHRTSATDQSATYRTCSTNPVCRSDRFAGEPVSLQQAPCASCLRLTGVGTTLVDCKWKEANDGRIGAEKNAVQDGGIVTYKANKPTTNARGDSMVARTSGTAELWRCGYQVLLNMCYFYT